MHAALLIPLLLQVKVGVDVKRDSSDTTRKEISVGVAVGQSARARREPKRIPVTDEHLRTAFRSSSARELLLRARHARMSQDSALLSYDATTYMRISAGLGFSRIGRDRLIFRHENATRVRWHRDAGAWIDVTGSRTVIPVAPKEAQEEAHDDVSNDGDVMVVPYYPGYEPLISLNGSGAAAAQVDERELVHPIAEGAEAYYTYEAGDSLVFRMPDNRTIAVRELRVRPREPKWNVAVGSLWFDTSTGQLVRAAYRLAVPLDIWAVVEEDDPQAKDDIPIWVRPIISPMRAQVQAIAVEYGLYQGRFWLPRIRSAEGEAQVSFMRVPFKFQQSFRYASVNAIDSLPTIDAPLPLQPPDSLDERERDRWRDSVRQERSKRRAAERDSVRQGLKPEPQPCDSLGVRTSMRRRYQEADLKVAVRVPCDVAALANSPDLPKSIYDDGEEIFGSKEMDALRREALAMGAQPPLSIGAIPPRVTWGLEFTRYNRIEALSSGVLVEQPLGAGYTASLFGRIGIADLEPNAELALARTNLSTTVRGRAYNRLVAANDWGNPLSFGASLSALLFGRDDGFYYRATGAELEWRSERGSLWSWRLFAEGQRAAAAETEFTLGARFGPNIVARNNTVAGAAARLVHSYGLDPRGFRTLTDVRVEGAVSDSAAAAYARGAADITFSDAFGPATWALTLSGGATAGNVPPQRLWYLGGAHTVRGQRPDTAASGNAYWLTRVELGGAVQALRPVIFADAGWVGDRSRWRDVGRPLSGLGIGVSVLDGLLRFDVARGIYPQKRITVDMYVNARF